MPRQGRWRIPWRWRRGRQRGLPGKRGDAGGRGRCRRRGGCRSGCRCGCRCGTQGFRDPSAWRPHVTRAVPMPVPGFPGGGPERRRWNIRRGAGGCRDRRGAGGWVWGQGDATCNEMTKKCLPKKSQAKQGRPRASRTGLGGPPVKVSLHPICEDDTHDAVPSEGPRGLADAEVGEN